MRTNNVSVWLEEANGESINERDQVTSWSETESGGRRTHLACLISVAYQKHFKVCFVIHEEPNWENTDGLLVGVGFNHKKMDGEMKHLQQGLWIPKKDFVMGRTYKLERWNARFSATTDGRSPMPPLKIPPPAGRSSDEAAGHAQSRLFAFVVPAKEAVGKGRPYLHSSDEHARLGNLRMSERFCGLGTVQIESVYDLQGRDILYAHFINTGPRSEESVLLM